MADKSNKGIGFIIGGIKGFADIQAEKAKIAGDVMVNRLKEQDNWFYKMKEMKTKNDMDWQNRQRELEAIKNMFGGQEQPEQQPSGSYFGAGVNPSGGGVATVPVATEQPNNNPIDANQALENLAKRRGFEIVGYDQKGKPMIRKIKPPTVAEQKLILEQKENEEQQKVKSQIIKDSALDSLKTIAEVEKGIDKFGLFGQLPSIPGTPRANWEANVNKLLSGKIIALMTTMKEASKTGATGFGQLSNKELGVLQEASTALKRGLAPEDAQKYLNDMKVLLQKVTGEDQGGGKGAQYMGNADIQLKIKQAREAGYSDEEIQQYLKGQ